MKPPILRNLTKLMLVTGLALFFGLITVSSTLATAGPDPVGQPVMSLQRAPLVPLDKSTNIAATDAAPATPLDQVTQEVRALTNTTAVTVTGSSQLITDVLSQDWGDFDRDGYLDLALGTSSGISIYHNLAGQLVPSTTLTPGPVYGVRWADLNNDGLLELITVRNLPGANGIYRYTASGFVSYTAFNSALPLARVAVLSGTRDLIASTSAISTPCTVLRFQRNASGTFTIQPTCVSTGATANVSVGDFNNDGYSDLVLGSFPNDLKLLISTHAGSVLTDTQNSYIFDTAPSWPYDFAWGDYDGDGRLDLAAAFPLQRQVRVYHNEGSKSSPPFALSGVLPTQRFMTPLSIDWGDFNGDGALDLAVSDDPPRIYFNVNQSLASKSDVTVVSDQPTDDNQWGARAVALKNSDLSLALSGKLDPTRLYATAGGHLQSAIVPLAAAAAANSVAWGDANGDGRIDLLLGASTSTDASTLYWNANGTIGTAGSSTFVASNRQSVALGKLDRKTDAQLGMVIGGTDNTGRGSITVYTRTNATPLVWSVPGSVSALALGDFNNDGWLDLLVGINDSSGNGAVLLYRNNQVSFDSKPAFTTTVVGQVRSVAWADYDPPANTDGNRFLDFAVATSRRVYVFHNEHNNTFTNSSLAENLDNTAVAWGDFNNDDQLDLAVGTKGEGVRVYLGSGGLFSLGWTSTALSQTTSLAAGDWNNDGRIDLAVGNAGEPDQVYANLGETPGAVLLIPTWSSPDVGNTTALAWGDVNDDGYLDLAVSRQSGSSGVYYNTSVTPWRLSTPPSYLSIARPGKTADAYLYSSSEFLPGYISSTSTTFTPTVTIYYMVSNPAGILITNTQLELSLDGGASWQTPYFTRTVVPTQATSTGRGGALIWDARHDGVQSDNALFRIRVVDQAPIGPFQRAASAAVSPPFRVRTMSCQWLTGLWIEVKPSDQVQPFQTVTFNAKVSDYSGGTISYTWVIEDGPNQTYLDGGYSQVYYEYQNMGTFKVSVTAQNSRCLEGPPVQAVTYVHVGTYTNSQKIYLPLIQRSTATAQSVLPKQEVEEHQSRESFVATAFGSTTVCKTIWPATRPTVAWLSGVTGYFGQPALNQDGSRFAFWSTADLAGTNPDGNVELYYARVDRPGSCVTYTQITSSTGNILEGFNLGPAINAAGDRIAFFSDRNLTGENADQNFEIFLAQFNSNGSMSVTQVTDSARGVNALPTINAAGDRIAFVSDQDWTNSNADGNQEIYLASVDPVSGQAVYTQVTQTSVGTFNDEPAISASGQYIVLVRGGDQTSGLQEIFTGDTDQPGSLFAVTASSPQMLNYRPTIGGDGSQYSIAYATADLTHEVVNFAIVTGTNFSITPVYTAARNSLPALNVADGSRLVVMSGTQRISVLVPQSQGVIPINTCASPNCVYSAISGDGIHVAFASKGALYEAYYETATLALALNQPAVPIVAGTRLTRTIVLTNSGPGAADGVEFSSTLQAGPAAILSMTLTTNPTGVCSGNDTVTCRIPGVAVNSPAYITLTTNREVDADRLDPLTLFAGANAWQAVTTTISPNIVVATESDLKLAKNVASTAVAGELVTYTLTITNSGPSNARYVTLTDQLPDDLIFSSQRNLGGAAFNLTNTAGLITGTIDPLLHGVTATIQIVAQLTSTVPVGRIISNTGVITSTTFDPALSSNQSRADFTVTTRSNLTVTKSAPVTVTAGLPMTYTVIVTNTGPSAAYDVLITDSLPASVTVSSPPSGCLSSLGNTQITCTLAALNNGSSYTIQLMADTDSEIDEHTILTNRVFANAANAVRVVSNTATTETGVGSYLYITKTATVAVTAGEPLTYTIIVENRGPSRASLLTVTDPWPSNYISYTGYLAKGWYPRADPGYCEYTPGQVVCLDANGLANGYTQTYYLYATTYQTLPLGTVIANTAGVTSSGSLVSRFDTANTVINNTLSRLTAAKAADATVLAGNSVHYTVVVTNSGPSYARFVTVTDQLPAGVTFSSAGSSPTCSSSDEINVLCTLQDLYVGATKRQTVTISGNVSYTVDNGTVLTNMAVVTASNAAASVNVSAPTMVRTSSVMTISKTATDFVTTVTDPAASGEIVTYTIVVTNTGPSLARDVVVTDVLPANVTYLAQLSAYPPVIPSVAGQTLTWPLNTLIPGATNAMTFTGQVITSTVGPVTLTNTAYVTATTAPVMVTDTASTFVLPRVRLAVTKRLLTPQPVTAQSILTYQIAVQNLGPSVVPSVTLTDVLEAWSNPGGNQYGIETDAGYITWNGATCTRAPGSLISTCTVTPELAAGDTRLITLTAQTTRYLANGPAVTNTVYATSTIATAVVSDTAVGTTVAKATLRVTKTLSPLNAVPLAGQSLTYSVTVGNLGPSPASSVVLSDVLPTDLLTPTVASPKCGSAGQHVITCTIGSIDVGAEWAVTVTGWLPANLPRGWIITNTAQVSTPIASEITTTQLINTVAVQANLRVDKTAAATARAGTPLTYTIFITNDGPSPAPSVIVTDRLPISVTYLSQLGSYPSITSPISNGKLLTWTLPGDLAPLATQIITFNVQVTNTLGGSAFITNTVYATSTSAPAVAIGSAMTQLQAQSSLALTKTVLTANPVAGGNLTYGITVTNLGPSPLSSVTITDQLPSEVTYGSASSGCNPPVSSVITCTNASALAAGSSWPITITGGIRSNATTAFTNTAYATSTVATASVSSAASTTPAIQVNLQVTKTVSPLSVAAGESLTYTIVAGNQGVSDASAVNITDSLPSELSFVSASPGYTLSNGVITFSLSSLTSGEQHSITLTGRINTSVLGGTVVTNSAYISSAIAAAGDSSLVTSTIASRSSLRVTKQAQSPVLAGNPLTYTIFITNDGPSLAPIITLTDQLSTSLTIGGAPTDCTRSGNAITCTLTTVDVGGAYSRSVMLTPTVNSNIVSGTQIVNTVVVSGSNAIANANHTITTTVWTAANLAIGTTVTPTSVYSNTGGPVKVTIVFTNAGPSDARSVYITETLAVLTYTQAIAQPAYVSGPTSDLNCSGIGRPQRCTWSISILTGTFTGTIEFTATAPITSVSYTQGITAQITSTLTLDPSSSDNTSSGGLFFARVWSGIYWAGLLPTRWPVAFGGLPAREVWPLSP